MTNWVYCAAALTRWPCAHLHPSPQVREYEASASLFAESRAKRSELQDALKEHEGDLKALRQEMDVQVGRPAGQRTTICFVAARARLPHYMRRD